MTGEDTSYEIRQATVVGVLTSHLATRLNSKFLTLSSSGRDKNPASK